MFGLEKRLNLSHPSLKVTKHVPSWACNRSRPKKQHATAVYSPRQGSYAPPDRYRRPQQQDRGPQRQNGRPEEDFRRRQRPYDDRATAYDDRQPEYQNRPLIQQNGGSRQQQYAPGYQGGYNRRELSTPQSRTYGQQRVIPRRQIRPRFSPPAEDEVILSCNQIINKQVITRVTGNSLGNVSNFFVDPDTLQIVSAALRPKGISLGSAGNGNLLLETFCQIGDVVLVHDESVLDLVPQDESVGFLDLIGCPVYTSQGEKLGKVRSFTFSPDSGKLDCIRYDALGWPAIPEGLVGVWEVGVECIEEIDSLARITLLPGTESELNRVSDGPLELAFVALQKLFTTTDEDAMAYETNRELDQDFEKWRLQYAPYFLKHYGQAPPATRQELDQFYMDLNSSGSYKQANQGNLEPAQSRPPVRRQPASLPPGRQDRMADVLQRAPQQEPVLRRPLEREDSRMRSQPLQSQSGYPSQAQQDIRPDSYGTSFYPETRGYSGQMGSENRQRSEPQAQRRQGSYDNDLLMRENDLTFQSFPAASDPARGQARDQYEDANRAQYYSSQDSRQDWGQNEAQPVDKESNTPRSTSASTPLYDFRPQGPPHERQDADGGFGESQVRNDTEASRKKSFDDWVQATEQMSQLSMAGAPGYAQGPASQPRTELDSPSPSAVPLPQAAQSYLPVQPPQPTGPSKAYADQISKLPNTESRSDQANRSNAADYSVIDSEAVASVPDGRRQEREFSERPSSSAKNGSFDSSFGEARENREQMLGSQNGTSASEGYGKEDGARLGQPAKSYNRPQQQVSAGQRNDRQILD